MKRARLDDDTIIIGPFPWSRKRRSVVWKDDSPRGDRDTVRDSRYCKCTSVYENPANHLTYCYCMDGMRVHNALTSGNDLHASEMCKPIQHGDYMLHGHSVFIVDYKGHADETFFLYWLASKKSLKGHVFFRTESIFHWITQELPIPLNRQMIESAKIRNTYRDKCYTFVHCLLTRLGFYRDLRQMIAYMVFETR